MRPIRLQGVPSHAVAPLGAICSAPLRGVHHFPSLPRSGTGMLMQGSSARRRRAR